MNLSNLKALLTKAKTKSHTLEYSPNHQIICLTFEDEEPIYKIPLFLLEESKSDLINAGLLKI